MLTVKHQPTDKVLEVFLPHVEYNNYNHIFFNGIIPSIGDTIVLPYDTVEYTVVNRVFKDKQLILIVK